MKRWDVFICHASEDKDSIVRPLAADLAKRGLRVWFDEHILTLGDCLRTKIDYGLSQSRYGVVVLSPAFFAKDWPQRELDGLLAMESAGRKVILPVWHAVECEEVAARSPTLAGRVAARTSKGLNHVSEEVLRAVSPSELPSAEANHCVRGEWTVQQGDAAVLGISLQKLSDLARLQGHTEYAGSYHYMRMQVLARVSTMQLSRSTTNAVTKFATGKGSSTVHNVRLAIRDDMAGLHGIRVVAAFETGYQISNLSAYCSLLAAAHVATTDNAASITTALRNLATVIEESGLNCLPGRSANDVPEWLRLIGEKPTDAATYALIERESYSAICALLQDRGLPGRSYEL